MYKVLVFAGTTEGYEICRFLAEHQVETKGFVATEYGSKSLTENEFLTVQTGRLDEAAMEQVFAEEKPEMILDATHPYAAEVTVNIRTACEKTQIPYQRVLRESGTHEDKAVYVESVQAAAEYLDQTQGNILLTTGSKELAGFTGMKDYQERLYARVLSLPNVMQACAELGFEGKHLIGMQGPFSRELNAAMLRQYDCKYLVTKDTGRAGGFQDKIDAALECDAVPVIIGRPLKEEGMSVKECKRFLTEHFSLTHQPHITLLGIGMGSPEMLTVQGKNSLDHADLLIGARRMVDSVKCPGQDVFIEYRSQEIKNYIDSHPEYDNIVIVLSGDVGFYSGAKKLQAVLAEDADFSVRVEPGISSLVYFCAKIGVSWEDAAFVSLHGQHCNFLETVRRNRKTLAIAGGKGSVREICQTLSSYGWEQIVLHVGTDLSYPEEQIVTGTPFELAKMEFAPLAVLLFENPNPEPEFTAGMADEVFLRDKVPMTKREVRNASLSHLQLSLNSVVYDIGSGTGSVSIEMALRAAQGKVYAIEKNPAAVALLQENKKKFAVDHLEIIEGTAPEALEALPVPTHTFIGGSAGNLKEILELLLRKNPNIRVVLNTVTVETLAEAASCFKKLAFEEPEIVCLQASNAKKAGRSHLMIAQNPVYIFTAQGGAKAGKR